MKRLVVLIGVRKPGGGLGELKSIEKCLTDMLLWALRQGIPREDIHVFTDIPSLVEKGDPPLLSIGDIYNWIEKRGQDYIPADQLLIYFSGHGMQSGGATLWLLAQAPEKTWEAVNLDASRDLAVWNRFKHVVFIGDCCATVAETAQFSGVKGAPILWNPPDELQILQQTVDVLRSSRPGRASLEVIIDGVSVSPYTVQLTRALNGTPSEILEYETPGRTQPLVLRVRKLAEELRLSVNTFLRAHGIKSPGQPMDAVVSTEEWVSLFSSLPARAQPPATAPPPPDIAPVPPGSFPFILDPGAGAPGFAPPAAGMGDQGEQPTEVLDLDLNAGLRRTASGSLRAIVGNDWSSKIPKDYHRETPCGFFVSGGNVRSAESLSDVECTVVSDEEIRVRTKSMKLVSIDFEDGGGIMIPAIPGQVGFVHLENGRCASLAYEPSRHADAGSSLHQEFAAKARRIRNVRDTLLNVVTGGDVIFTDIEPKTILDVMNDVHYGDRVDFTTVLYLAYLAYASRFAKPALSSLRDYMRSQFGFVPYDLKILLRLARIEPTSTFVVPGEFAPPFPLLTQGWSLLQATRLDLGETLNELRAHYWNAPWTHLDPVGVQVCRTYLAYQSFFSAAPESGVRLDSEESNYEVAQPAWDFLFDTDRGTATQDESTQAYPDDDEDRGMTMTTKN